jgi:outer membrane protein OmpA-like peptidoglycan-associated protein
MRKRAATVFATAILGGCALLSGEPATETFSVFFAPYSAALDQPAQDAIQLAADFALRHPTQPVILLGYAVPPGPGLDIPSLSDQRNAAVKGALAADGISLERIYSVAIGTPDPKANMPQLSVRRVDISVGAPPT